MFDTLFVFGSAHAAASMFGALMLGACCVSAVFAYRQLDRRRFVLAINAALPLFVILVILRQQSIQGFRYLVFIEFFLLEFNLLMLRGAVTPQSTARPAGADARVLACVGLVWWRRILLTATHERRPWCHIR